MSTITLTFGDMAENHVGMEQLGTLGDAGTGFNKQDLQEFRRIFKSMNCNAKLISLNKSNIEADDAHILIVEQGIHKLLREFSEFDYNDLLAEQESLPYDRHAFMYGRVVNKKARWNICFDSDGHPPDYENKLGTVISWSDAPITKTVYDILVSQLGSKVSNLKCEGNYYYNTEICGIGYHGDSERRKVMGMRLGEPLPLSFAWYQRSERLSEPQQFLLKPGTIYFMSEKATGTDWKKRSIPTLRHAAGCEKFIA